jgi:hypothetical protein
MSGMQTPEFKSVLRFVEAHPDLQEWEGVLSRDGPVPRIQAQDLPTSTCLVSDPSKTPSPPPPPPPPPPHTHTRQVRPGIPMERLLQEGGWVFQGIWLHAITVAARNQHAQALGIWRGGAAAPPNLPSRSLCPTAHAPTHPSGSATQEGEGQPYVVQSALEEWPAMRRWTFAFFR